RASHRRRMRSQRGCGAIGGLPPLRRRAYRATAAFMRRIAIASVIVAACSGGSTKQTAVSTTAQPSAEPAVAPAPPPVDPHTDAKQRVARLTAEADQNPLLAAWTGPYGGVPPWDKVKANLFPAAFAKGIELRAAEIDVIATNPEPPTFDNTYAALDNAGRHLDRAETLFSVMTTSLNTPDVQAVDREWSPKLTAATDAIIFNKQLFDRMDAVYAKRNEAGLTPEQVRMVEEVYDRFVRAGAKLTPEQKKQMGSINQELAVAFTDFSNRVLEDEDTWVVLEKEEDLAGLPAD